MKEFQLKEQIHLRPGARKVETIEAALVPAARPNYLESRPNPFPLPIKF